MFKSIIPRDLSTHVFLLLLIPSAIGYFIFVRLFQDALGIVNDYVADAFFGYPILPEPFEIPLYLLGYIVIPLFALILYHTYAFLKRKRLLKTTLTLIVIVFALGAVYVLKRIINTLPGPEFFVTYFQTHTLSHALWLVFTKRLYSMVVILGLSVAFFIALVVFWKRPTLSAFVRHMNLPLWKKIAPWFFIFLAIVVFSPELTVDEGHYNYVIGPVNDMLHGKPLLYETIGQYGILNTYILAAIFSYVIPISYTAIFIIVAVLYYLFFVGVYFLMKHWTGSRLLGYISVLGSLAIYYFPQTSPYLNAIRFPGPSPYRQGMYILVALALLAFFKTKKQWLRELTLALGALSLFWNIDTGAYITIALFVAFSYFHWIHHRALGQKIVHVLLHGIHQFAYILLVFLGINFFNIITYGSSPDWSLLYSALTFYESGYSKLPLPLIGIFIVYIISYVNLLVWMLYRMLHNKKIDVVFIFIVVYGIFSFNYYVGNSAWSYLYPVSTPLILALVYLFSTRLRAPLHTHRFAIYAFYTLIFFSIVMLVFKLPVEFSKRNYLDLPERISKTGIYEPDLSADADTIMTRFAAYDRIPLFHLQDGKLLILSGKVNYFDMYDTGNLVYQSEMKQLIEQIHEERPPFILLGSVRDVRINMLEKGISDIYTKKESLRTLDIYTLRTL